VGLCTFDRWSFGVGLPNLVFHLRIMERRLQ